MTLTDMRPAASARAPSSGWFRAFWRWHFYASFLVIPFLLMLSVTGLIYLLRFQIEPLMHRELMVVTAPDDPSRIQIPYEQQQQAVESTYSGATMVSMTEPGGPDDSTRFSIETSNGSRDVYVDPWSGDVLGSLDPDTTLSGYAVRIHGDLMAGTWGDYAIELAACWAIVMAITGYLIFIKGRKARRRRVAAGAGGARLRSRHGVVGTIVGVGLLTLLVSGLPWTGFWGSKVQNAATERGTSLWSLDPGALSDPASTLDESLPHSHVTDIPWALGKTEVPTSDPDSGDGRSVANLDTAIAVASQEGLRHPMTVALPADEGGVYSTIGYAFDAPTDERTVHVDRYGGQVVSTYGFDDYPKLAQVVSQGIGLHEGRTFGAISFWGALTFCLGVIFLCVTGPWMWWRRRPKGAGTVGAPRGKLPIRATWWVAVLLVALGVFLPLFGMSLAVILVLDQFLIRRISRLREWFAVT